jgi:hypothetical protein
LKAASADSVATQASCDDLEYSFVHSNCSTMHKKHVRLKHPRVATSVIGRPDLIPLKAKTSAHSPTEGEGERPQVINRAPRRNANESQNKVESAKSEDPKIRCARAGATSFRCN